MSEGLQTTFLFLISIFVACVVDAGSYIGTAVCPLNQPCGAALVLSSPPPPDEAGVPPFAISHPPGYDGTGGVIEVKVCLAIGLEAFRGPLRRAIATWNALEATTGNCTGTGCKLWEEPGSVSGKADAESIFLHELGHCALGLDHVERPWDAQVVPDGVWEDTSFTRSWGVASPPDGIQLGSMTDFRGSRFNAQVGAPGEGDANSVSWYRVADNNPFSVDNTVIDSMSFSRSINNLPTGSIWMANANRRVAEDLGLSQTQAVMYGAIDLNGTRQSLTADDVNMVKMGMTGVDLQAGTPDDYTVRLVESCEGFFTIFVQLTQTQDPETFAECKLKGVDYSFPQNPFLARHFTVIPPDDGFFTFVLNEEVTWDTVSLVFADGFETGDTSGWDQTVP